MASVKWMIATIIGVINYLLRVNVVAREWEWQSEDRMQGRKTSQTIITQIGNNRGFT